MRILTVGPTPAWQQILTFERFQENQVNRVEKALWMASGKGVNAAFAVRTLQRTGRKNEPAQRSIADTSVLLTFLGGAMRDPMLKDIQEKDLLVRSVETQTRTRVCTTLLNKSRHEVTELVEHGGRVSEEEQARVLSLFLEEAPQADAILLMGSLPMETPSSFYGHLLKNAASSHAFIETIPVIADIRGEELLKVIQYFEHRGKNEPSFRLSQQPSCLLKPNRRELAATLKQELSTEGAFYDALRQLPLPEGLSFLITDESNPVWWVTRDGFFRFTPPFVSPSKIVSPIGCGDSMSGALAWFLSETRFRERESEERASLVESVREFLRGKKGYFSHFLQTVHWCAALKVGLAAAAWNLQQIEAGRLDATPILTSAQTIRFEFFPRSSF